MRVLWIVNTIFPELAEELKLDKIVYGGWMYGLADALVNNTDIKLSIATVHDGEYIEKKVNNKIYILIPNKDKSSIKNYWKKVKEEQQPNVVHIHGTEYNHGLLYMQQNGADQVVFSIQGLVNVYERYYLSGLSFKEIISNITFRDIVRWDNLYQQKYKFKKRGVQEQEYFKRSKHVIGRTDWDKVHAYFNNKNITYHFCNEMLRSGFYSSKKWSITNCEQHTIFLSQANYPLKGLHKVLEAVALLKDEFPNIKIKIGGHNIIKEDTFVDKLKLTGYGNFIKNKIRKLDLIDNVEFLGNLQEEQMINEYLKANVFICPSAIENSPNSLGEAQLLGVPSIAAYVGGTPNMITNGVDGLLYRFEEIEMLAYQIKQLFINNDLCKELSKNAILASDNRHDKNNISKQILSIYKNISITNKL